MIRSFPLASFGISCHGGSGGNQLHSAMVSGVRAGVWHQWAFLAIGTWRFCLQWEVPLSREHILFQKLLCLCRNAYEHGLLLNGNKYFKSIKLFWESESKSLFRFLQKLKLPKLSCAALPKHPLLGSDLQETQLGQKS